MKGLTGVAEDASEAVPEGSAHEEMRAEFLATFQRRRAHLQRLATRMTGCSADAEDIVQESMLKALTHLSGFRMEARMDTWLHAIVLNTARSWLRTRRGRRQDSLEGDGPWEEGAAAPMEIPQPGENPEERCWRYERNRLLWAEIMNMDQRYGGPIRLCDLDERSYREAAYVLQVSDTTLKARLFRGRSMLRRRLSQLKSRPLSGERKEP
jgi:RNA polymerase sigma-70 factor, ECF subfamily